MMKIPSPAAVAIDLDGTLIDSRLDIAAACNHTLTWAGREALPLEVVGSYVGDGASSLLMRAFAIERDAPELSGYLAEFLAFYSANPIAHTTWMPGARDLLATLRAAPVKVALVTNKLRGVTLQILEALGAADDFDTIYAGGDGPLKPSPEPIVKVMRTMNATPEATWVVGDGTQDIGAGRAAGCVTIAVIGGFHDHKKLHAAQPDWIVSSLSELIPHV